jgi:predicted GNAT superfamily acetyltransferase
MKEEDLPGVRILNNKHEEAVGLVTKAKLSYLFSCSFHSLVVKDGDQVVAFCITHGAGLDYNSPNYTWHSKNSPDPNFVYIDRIVVDENYQNR